MKVVIIDSINDVDRDQWDQLHPQGVFRSHGWLTVMEQTMLTTSRPRYFTVHANNTLVAGAVCYILKKSARNSMLDSCMFGRFKKQAQRIGFSFLPSLVCCPTKGVGLHLFSRKDLPRPERQQAIHDLLAAIELEAAANNMAVCFNNVLGDETELVKILEGNGYHRSLSFPLNTINIQWPDFAGYLQHTRRINNSKKYDKKVIVHEMNRNRKSGVIIEEIQDPAPEQDRLFNLLSRNYRGHNQIPFPFRPNFLSCVKDNLGENAIILRARKNGKINGVILILKWEQTWYCTMIGIDHELSGNDFTYFNLAYYRPIADAIAAGAHTIFYGSGLNKTKARRGCTARRTYVYYKSHRRLQQILLRPWFSFHRNWYEKKLSHSLSLTG